MICPRCETREISEGFKQCWKCDEREKIAVAREIAYGHGFLDGYAKGVADTRAKAPLH